MRSVVVVLPASMCAMIPMFRVFWRLNLRGMVFCSLVSLEAVLGWSGELSFGPDAGKKRGPPGPRALPVESRFGSLCAEGLHLYSHSAAGRVRSTGPHREARPTIPGFQP